MNKTNLVKYLSFFYLQLDAPDGILKDDQVKRTPEKFLANA